MCADLQGGHAPGTMRAPLCGMHVCLLDVISMRLWDLFFDSVMGGGGNKERREGRGETQLKVADKQSHEALKSMLRMLYVKSDPRA